MTIEEIKKKGFLLFECISGSKAYGLETPTSDTDIKGVFVLPKELYYSMNYIGQINNETNDEVYYELKKFIELCAKNNPNILELLNVPEGCVLYKDPLFDKIKIEVFLSKLCNTTFSNYAFTQIKKARGLQNKIVNPIEKELKHVEDFCKVKQGKKVIPFKEFVKQNDYQKDGFGIAKIPHIKDCYHLFYSNKKIYKGIAKAEANDLCLSSISKEEIPVGMLYFNKDGYSTYCKKYKEYWDWVEKRNEERYTINIAHERNYDSKNMMHTFRLLHMAKGIAEHQKLKIKVSKQIRSYFLSIKKGEFEYEDLVTKAKQLKDELVMLYQNSNLIDEPNLEKVNTLLFEVRNDFYKRNNI